MSKHTFEPPIARIAADTTPSSLWHPELGETLEPILWAGEQLLVATSAEVVGLKVQPAAVSAPGSHPSMHRTWALPMPADIYITSNRIVVLCNRAPFTGRSGPSYLEEFRIVDCTGGTQPGFQGSNGMVSGIQVPWAHVRSLCNTTRLEAGKRPWRRRRTATDEGSALTLRCGRTGGVGLHFRTAFRDPSSWSLLLDGVRKGIGLHLRDCSASEWFPEALDRAVEAISTDTHAYVEFSPVSDVESRVQPSPATSNTAASPPEGETGP